MLSTRAPGVDQTSNRIDRQQRDRRARQAVEHFLDVMVEQLAVPAAASA